MDLCKIYSRHSIHTIPETTSVWCKLLSAILYTYVSLSTVVPSTGWAKNRTVFLKVCNSRMLI